MAKVFLEQIPTQFGRVGEIAIVSQAQTVRRINIKGLRQGRAGTACRGVSDMTDTHIASQSLHVPRPKDILDQSIVLAQIQFAIVTRGNTCGILPAMLQYSQRIVQTHCHI